MSGLDLPEIRARLAGPEKARRNGRRGPLHSLKSLLTDEAQRSLLGPPGEWVAEQTPLASAPDAATLPSIEDSTAVLAARRSTFGRRGEADPKEESEPLLLTSLETASRPATTNVPDPWETPDFFEFEVDAKSATAAGDPNPAHPAGAAVTGRWLLERLQQRLLDEQMGLLAKLASAGCSR